MNTDFQAHVDSLHPSLERLSPISVEELRRRKGLSGIYLFSENGVSMYVGRTRDLRKRYDGHCGIKSGENKAAFAFKLARIETGNEKAAYSKRGSRKELLKDPIFRTAFERAKVRISKMELHFIEERGPIRQTLLEIYASFVLKAKHNDFDTH